ncbi:TonB-dependent siderophore receptor [Teredinibacter haidensis]|uniref:TonB-dependent siderophore receptor n=1 Tax=Teredinibacter haidensis TaxID=2731755 RepID=UPI000948F8BF|nr:TonB-dependent siderophore receptor [Teredinibacter haidensis]
MDTFQLPYKRAALACAITLCFNQQATAQQEESANFDIEEMHIIGLREERISKGAIGLNLSLFDTPQSVSVLDSAFIDGFALNDVNELLKLAAGVNVDEVETDRTYYNSRGFDIKSMQVDGRGLPFNWNVVGDLDTSIYDKVEVVRGANGLLTGTGNPSGTINYVRKRPTNNFQAEANVSVGSWSQRRVEADISTPFTTSGSWAGRVVIADLSTDTHLDNNSKQRRVFYGIVDGQIANNATLSAGISKQKARSEGVLWGALPLQYTNGEQAEYGVSESTTMNWTYWETDNTNLFVELQLELSDWQWTTTITHNEYEEPSELFYVNASPGLDAETGTGLYGWPGKYLSTVDQDMVDSTLSGSFGLGGRNHELVLGINLSKASNGYLDYIAPAEHPAWGALPAFPGWNGDEISRPEFGASTMASDFDIDTQRLYAASHWNLSDSIKLIAGANFIDATSEGYSFEERMDWNASETSPYLGLTYQVTEGVNLYASYSDIYEPQAELNEQLRNIGPAVGTSSEAGLKAELFERQLLTSISIFRAEQENYAESAGFDTDSGLSYSRGVEVNSQGFELEASGQVNQALQITASYTQLELETPEGEEVRTYVPRKTIKLSARYSPIEKLTLGTHMRWQNEIYTGDITQSSYALFSAYASYDLSEQVNISLHANNITDKKYLTSLYWEQSYYGAPRNIQLRAAYQF